MEWWQIFGIVFIFLTAMFVYSSFAEAAERKKQGSSALVPATNNMLDKWNESEISHQLNRLQETPSLLVHYVESVRRRFIEKQDVKTAAVRIDFLEKQVKFLELANQYQGLRDELALRKRGFDNELLKIDLENQTIRFGFKDEAAERKIRDLENQQRVIERQLELAQLKKQLDEINNPPQAPPPPISRKEARARELADIEDRIAKLEEEKKRLDANNLISADAKQMQMNQITNKLFELYQKRLDLI